MTNKPADPAAMERRDLKIKIGQNAAPLVGLATVYAVEPATESVILHFGFASACHGGSGRFSVWIPRAVLAQTILRDRGRLRSNMRAWADRPMDGRSMDLGSLAPVPSVAVSANVASVAVSDVGSSIRFFWFAPEKFAQRMDTLLAEPVLEMRMPGELVGRLWCELDGLAGEDIAPPEDAKESNDGPN